MIENFNLLSSFLFSGRPIKKKGTVRRRADIFSALLSMQGVKLSSLFLLSRDLSWIDGFRGIKVKREIETDRQKARIPPHTHFSSLITSVAAASHCEMWEGTKTRYFFCAKSANLSYRIPIGLVGKGMFKQRPSTDTSVV